MTASGTVCPAGQGGSMLVQAGVLKVNVKLADVSL